ncbi:MAG TPA: hypothetical protein VK179_13300 [Bacteroidales bacterium]|nr:hypothetical protein [Bacteroidales bacterium]
MKEKNLRILVYITGFICLIAFIAIRNFPLMNALLSDKMDRETKDFETYGDLYYSNNINHFKVDLPKRIRKYRLSEKNPAVNDADILTFGDSFFDFSFQKTFPERLSDTLNQKVYSFVTQDPVLSNPFCVLNQASYPLLDKPKIVIFETVERNIPIKFTSTYDISCRRNEFKKSLYNEIHAFIFKPNSEQLYSLLLKRGHFIHNIYSAIVTLRFDWFGYISPMTAKYKMQKDPWLFYEKEFCNEPGGFYYKYSDQELNNIADNIFRLQENLKEKYNLDLIFMPIPNKYSLYHKMINNDQYNNFLPLLYAELDKRGVRYINLYREFSSARDTLYYGTDTHWNKKGLDKALNLMLNEMYSDSSLAVIREKKSHNDNPDNN